MYCGKTSTLSSCCFKGDEFIKYEDEFGVKHISTIKNFVEKYTDDIGEGKIDDLSKIISMNPTTQELEPTNITGFLCKTNEYKKLIKFTVGDNEIFVTPDHLFLAKHKVTGKIVEIKAEDLKDSFMLYQLPISEQN